MEKLGKAWFDGLIGSDDITLILCTWRGNSATCNEMTNIVVLLYIPRVRNKITCFSCNTINPNINLNSTTYWVSHLRKRTVCFPTLANIICCPLRVGDLVQRFGHAHLNLMQNISTGGANLIN